MFGRFKKVEFLPNSYGVPRIKAERQWGHQQRQNTGEEKTNSKHFFSNSRHSPADVRGTSGDYTNEGKVFYTVRFVCCPSIIAFLLSLLRIDTFS
jgi:hypothetical protein